MLTKKHFRKIAEILKWWGSLSNKEARGRFWELEEKFIEFLKEENSRFDEARFRKAVEG